MATQAMQPHQTFAGYTELETKVCPVCGVMYAAPARLFRYHDEHGGEWYCPNGHNLVFIEPKGERLERQLSAERARSARLAAARDQAEASARANRGAATRARNQRDRERRRVANGVCPCCNRTFKNVARHMQAQHPEFGPTGEHDHE